MHFFCLGSGRATGRYWRVVRVPSDVDA